MDRRYSEDDLLLILNYDTNNEQVLTLTERCLFHQWVNEIHFDKRQTASDELKGKAAAVLTEIHHKNYRFAKIHYAIDTLKKQLLIIKTF